MKTRSIVWIVVVVIVIIILAVMIGKKGPATPSQTVNMPQQPAVVTPTQVKPTTSTPATKPASTASTPAAPVAQYHKINIVNTTQSIYYSTSTVKDMVRVYNPATNTSITSPLTIGGLASSSWYNNGYAPVVLTDTTGRIIAQGSVVAQGNWKSNEQIPFTATFPFPAQPTGSNGVIIFKSANSDAHAVEILVKFK